MFVSFLHSHQKKNGRGLWDTPYHQISIAQAIVVHICGNKETIRRKKRKEKKKKKKVQNPQERTFGEITQANPRDKLHNFRRSEEQNRRTLDRFPPLYKLYKTLMGKQRKKIGLINPTHTPGRHK